MVAVSIVLPCYRAASLARRSVNRLIAFLESLDIEWEIIVVDDGGGDFSPDPFAADRRVKFIAIPENQGKGFAVSTGMRSATGMCRIFTDVDLPYDLELIPAIFKIMSERRFHVVIGDRTLPTSSYTSIIPLRRRIASVAFTKFVGTLVTGGFFDTQCGLKAVRGDVADELFRLIRLQRFAFDVELVYVALKSKLDIHRIPVQLRNNETSSVRLIRDSVRGLADIFRIKFFQLSGAYDSSVLEALRQREFDQVIAQVRAS